MADTPVQIRNARPDDLDAIDDLHTRSRNVYHRGYVAEEILADPARAERRRADLEFCLAADDRTVLCAWRDERLAGFAVWGPCVVPDPDPQITTELAGFYVDPASFRQRVGSTLHGTCVQAWQTLPTPKVRLWVSDYNKQARAFYASQGWEQDGHHRPDDPAMLGYRLTV